MLPIAPQIMNDFQIHTHSTKSNGFRWMSADAYLFDIDGTLLVSRDRVHRNALHRAMREAYGVDTTIDGIAYHGKTDLGILRAALERVGVSADQFEANLPAALAVVCRDVSANASRITPTVCSAIPQVLAELRAAANCWVWHRAISNRWDGSSSKRLVCAIFLALAASATITRAAVIFLARV